MTKGWPLVWVSRQDGSFIITNPETGLCQTSSEVLSVKRNNLMGHNKHQQHTHKKTTQKTMAVMALDYDCMMHSTHFN